MHFSLRTNVMAIVALAILTVAAPPAAAQQSSAPAARNANNHDPAAMPTPRLSDGHPDLNGFWAIGRGPDTPVNSGFGQRNPDIKRGDARNAAAQYADPNQPPYKPELKAKVEELARNESKVDTACPAAFRASDRHTPSFRRRGCRSSSCTKPARRLHRTLGGEHARRRLGRLQR